MTENADILLQMIQEQWSQARQSESQRATMTNYIIAISSAILGFIVDKGLVRNIWPLTILLIVLGIYGALFSAKLYERFRHHIHRVDKMMRRLDALYPDAQIQ